MYEHVRVVERIVGLLLTREYRRFAFRVSPVHWHRLCRCSAARARARCPPSAAARCHPMRSASVAVLLPLRGHCALVSLKFRSDTQPQSEVQVGSGPPPRSSPVILLPLPFSYRLQYERRRSRPACERRRQRCCLLSHPQALPVSSPSPLPATEVAGVALRRRCTLAVPPSSRAGAATRSAAHTLLLAVSRRCVRRARLSPSSTVRRARSTGLLLRHSAR